jgi:hypothetical protein
MASPAHIQPYTAVRKLAIRVASANGAAAGNPVCDGNWRMGESMTQV